MYKYVSLAKLSMQNTVAYRGTFIISILGNFIYLLSIFYLWNVVFTAKEQLGGLSWDQMKGYLIISFFMNGLISFYSEGTISGKIVDGSVALDMLKPVDFQKARLSEVLGAGVFESFVSIVMIFIMAPTIFSGVYNPHWYTWLLLLVSVGAALLIKFGIIYLTCLLCFYTTSRYGLSLARTAIMNLLSGALIPLIFFPKWLEVICTYLPFQGIVFIPASIYLERVDGAEAIGLIGLQLVWVVILWWAGKLLWNWAIKQVTIHGG
ncbi:ABC-2 family transporter protein [Paenibacillus sp. HB172176]|uniref:ABC transporter permease n=1 Tax=Paenibacillus sp. HB172176 TaxID=2493690 RepID=UPI001F107353|nr:ABC-2 family transporter protein [Paenibacillus sp. HB172176]